jgi:hypothetical protein
MAIEECKEKQTPTTQLTASSYCPRTRNFEASFLVRSINALLLINKVFARLARSSSDPMIGGSLRKGPKMGAILQMIPSHACSACSVVA